MENTLWNSLNTEFHWLEGKQEEHCFCKKRKFENKTEIKVSSSFGPVMLESSVENKKT